jgi:hypothetical protein
MSASLQALSGGLHASAGNIFNTSNRHPFLFYFYSKQGLHACIVKKDDFLNCKDSSVLTAVLVVSPTNKIIQSTELLDVSLQIDDVYNLLMQLFLATTSLRPSDIRIRVEYYHFQRLVNSC